MGARCDSRDVDASDVVWVRGAKFGDRPKLLVNRECRKCGLGRVSSRLEHQPILNLASGKGVADRWVREVVEVRI